MQGEGGLTLLDLPVNGGWSSWLLVPREQVLALVKGVLEILTLCKEGESLIYALPRKERVYMDKDQLGH